jgi:hypothetical protein
MQNGDKYGFEESLTERELDEILLLIAHGGNLINIVFEKAKEGNTLYRRWAKAEDIEQVYVVSDLPPEMELAPNVEVIGQSDGNKES